MQLSERLTVDPERADDDGLDTGDDGTSYDAPDRPAPWLTRLLAVVVAVSLVALGGALAVILKLGSDSATAAPAETSVDVGFARDMTAHHRQAVEMASWVRDHTTDPAIKLLAVDIESTQLTQVGQMQGLLVAWDRPQFGGTPMAWMAGEGHDMTGMTSTAGMQLQSNGLMPGMATDAEMDKLESLSGEALDTYFLQLMLRHHEGGLPMADYAAKNAETPGVREMAKGMATSQRNEIQQMTALLEERGAEPLPTTG